MAKCYVTGKTTVTGNKRSHALNATRRTWKANLQTVHIKDENGNVKKVKISARALKKGYLVRCHSLLHNHHRVLYNQALFC